MEVAALARRDLPFVEYAWEFCGLAMRSGLDDATINSLFWIGANYYCPVDLPETTGLSWREGILRCLESVQLQFRTSPRTHPEPSQPTPRLAEPEPEPTVDREPEPRATEPSPMGVTAREITTEPEPIESDQVQEPATMPATVDVPVGSEGAEDSTAHCTAEGERHLDLGHLNVEQDLIDFSEDTYVELPAYPELSACLDFPPTLPLLSPPDSPAAHPQLCGGLNWRIPRLRLQPLSPGLRLSPSTQQLHPGSQLPRLHRRPSFHQLHRAPSSLRLRLGRSSSRHRLKTPLLWLHLVTLSHRLHWAPPSLQLRLSPLSLRPLCGPMDLQLHLGRQSLGLCLGPPDPQCHPRPIASPSPSRAPPPPVPPPSVGPLESSALLPPWHDSSFRRLRRGLPSWLRSGSRLAAPAQSPFCLLPPSDPPWILLSPPWLLPPSSPPWTLFVVLLLGVRPPPEPPPTLIFCYLPTSSVFLFFLRRGGGGSDVTPLWTVYVDFSLLYPYMVIPVPFLVKSLLVNHPHLSLYR
ncbi:Cytochrome c biogenesis protein CcsA [Labeo rohita]|uniref:Cytochrome c biogenesis protein CcsA n=1 Tax=Labeo rohita TaxID=84645 RepID=A0ABQ8MB99_LABRO|nr:Cytochrome c biogenesis protein CcsA [Labeo rohita]